MGEEKAAAFLYCIVLSLSRMNFMQRHINEIFQVLL